MRKIRRHQFPTRLAAMIGGGFVLVLAIALALAYTTNRTRPSGNQARVSLTPKPTINYGPATQTERAETEAYKQQLADQAKSTPAPTTGQASVAPLIASWGQDPSTREVSITAYVPGVYEDGGSCVLTLNKDNKTVTRTAAGFKDVNRTSCQPFAIPYAEVAAGTWSATVRYTSGRASGTSATARVEVQ